MATPRRRSARLRNSATPERSAVKKSSVENKLGSLVERDETPDAGAQAQPSLDTLLSTPNAPPGTALQDRMAQLSALKTPATAPHVSKAEMHPEHAYQSTAKSPDSGLRLGFTSIDNRDKSLAEVQNTPTKTGTPSGIPEYLRSPGFEFKFATESGLSNEARKLMENVREEAARIKEQMRLERDEQERKDGEAEDMFTSVGARGRKIAKPKGKAGRFSDVHVAEFKKMDSIANHASAFRARPGFLQPTAGSLKRKGSKAELDEPERPRTAGKSLSPSKASTTPRRRPAINSPSKSVPAPSTVGPTNHSPSKRPRLHNTEKLSTNSSALTQTSAISRPVTQPRSGFGFTSNLFTPTKASLARSASMKETAVSHDRPSTLPKSTSTKSLKSTSPSKLPSSDTAGPSNVTASSSVGKEIRSWVKKHQFNEASTATPKSIDRPLPPIPSQPQSTSKLSKLSGLKGILRRHQPLYSNDPIKIAAGTHVAYPSGSTKINEHLSNLSSDGIGTPDRRMTMGEATPSVKKRVEFTPSTKSRHALAMATSSPSKITIADVKKRQGTPYAPPSMFDPAAYLLSDDVHYPDLNLDSSSEPSSPAPPIARPIRQVRQQDVLDRHSPHFKSIFTTLHPRPATSAGSNATIEKSRSPSSSPFKPSPSTIRQVRPSGVGVQPSIQPFEDLQTVPHGIPGKKRRRESMDETPEPSGSRNTRRLSIIPSVPGGFPSDSPKNLSAEAPAAKRRKLFSPKREVELSMKENIQPKQPTNTETPATSPTKKPNAARMAAASAAKDRKTGGKGFLTMARLNALSRPKERK